jgi:hypothetical protein
VRLFHRLAQIGLHRGTPRIANGAYVLAPTRRLEA